MEMIYIVEVKVNSGICGFKTISMLVQKICRMHKFKIQTQCPNLKQMDEELKEVDAFDECNLALPKDVKIEIKKL